MRQNLFYLVVLLLSSSVIDETVCAPTKPPPKPQPKPTGTVPAIQSLRSLCKILNYDPFTHGGLTNHTLNKAGEPIKFYQTGYKDRVEYVLASVTPQTINSKGSVTNDATRKFARSMGKPTDDAGHIIGNKLGGTGKDTYNIFPQDLKINRGKWNQAEIKIRDSVLLSNQPVEVVVQLYYDKPQDTRPVRFFYIAAFDKKCESGAVINP
ncbi:hypothetical protein I4U23_005662 [Adineta vaga]|nr:hypothetical protein I4U23_005662 [Adineta vaga]